MPLPWPPEVINRWACQTASFLLQGKFGALAQLARCVDGKWLLGHLLSFTSGGSIPCITSATGEARYVAEYRTLRFLSRHGGSQDSEANLESFSEVRVNSEWHGTRWRPIKWSGAEAITGTRRGCETRSRVVGGGISIGRANARLRCPG